MQLGDIVNIVVSDTPRGVVQAGFGTPLIAGVHSEYSDRVRTYGGANLLADLVSDGFDTKHPIYLEAMALVAQTNKPQYVKVGKLDTSFTHKFDLAVQATVVEGKVYSFDLVNQSTGLGDTISYTALALDDENDVATGLGAAITASGLAVTPSVAANVVSVTADATDTIWEVQGDNALMSTDIFFTDTTVDTSLATDLALIVQADDDWYGLLLADPNSEARVTACAAYIETKEKIFGFSTHDTDVTVASQIFDALQALGYNRTFGLFTATHASRGAAAWMGKCLPEKPGSITWAYKTLAGVTADSGLPTAFESAIEGNNGNIYKTLQGLSVTWDGKMCGGTYIDLVRGRDHWVQRLRERVFTLFANSPKVPFTDTGISMVVAQIDAQNRESIANSYLAADPAPIIAYPAASEVSTANKIARTLPDISVTAYLAGAIHKVDPVTVTFTFEGS